MNNSSLLSKRNRESTSQFFIFNNTRCFSSSSMQSQENIGSTVRKIQELTDKLARKDSLNRKQVACELGRTLHVKALQPLCNIALFDKKEDVRITAISVIVDIIRANHKKLQSYNRRTFVIHNVLNSWNKFPSLKFINAVNWFFSSINLKYEEKEAVGLTKTILGKRDTLICNMEVRQGLTELSSIILSGVKCNTMKPDNNSTPSHHKLHRT